MNTRKLFIITAAIILLSTMISPPLYAKNYTKDQHLEMGGLTMSGIVTKVGVYNFFVKNSDGEEINIHTDSGTTQFSPENERLMVGDEISIVYLNHESASRSTNKKMAQYIEFLIKVPREFLTDEMECVVSLAQRNEKACYLPQYKKSVSFEGNWPEGRYHGREIDTSKGSRIIIKLKVVPANIGNGYVYKVKKIKPIE